MESPDNLYELMKRAHSYLLLELLIAFTLVGFCSLFLFRSPLIFLKEEIEALEERELARLSEVTFAEIRSDLIRRKLPPKGEKWGSYTLNKDLQIKIGDFSQKTFSSEYFIKTASSKKSADGKEYKRLDITLTFTPKNKTKPAFTFDYDVFVPQ